MRFGFIVTPAFFARGLGRLDLLVPFLGMVLFCLLFAIIENCFCEYIENICNIR